MENHKLENNEPIDLFKLIQNQVAPSVPKEVNPSELRYAIYVRKSTESEERQVRSIPDQIKDCIELVVEPNNISINPKTDVFKEEKSAKEAGTRPVFRDLMNKINDGNYDGIISWHYDRIARNMKEAGEIIDLIDRGLIKDLKLAKATFENTPNGKMILGISFVLSKHYSDHLSESVLRGNKSSTEKGRILAHQVHGYRISEDRKLIADDANYLTIEHAFRMRLDSKSLKEIAKYINGNGYQVHRLSVGYKISVFDEDKVSKLLRNPIYAGVNVYGNTVVRMTDIDADFTPMISEEEFIALNGKGSFLPYTMTGSKRVAPNNVSDFLRQFVVCGHCKRKLGTSVTSKYKTITLKNGKAGKIVQYYFRFKCNNKTCIAFNSGPKGSLIKNYVTDFLQTHLFTTKSNYKRYLEDAEIFLQERKSELTSSNKSLTSLLSKKRREYDDAKTIAANSDNPLSVHYTPKHLDKLKKEVDDYDKQVITIRKKLNDQKSALITYEEYLKLYENAADLLRSTYGMGMADELIRIFFSNLTVISEPYGKKMKQKQWSIVDHCLNEPFDDFVKNGDFLTWSG
jgi:DNA invertase Pin-like site-specific DNA recombinase